MTAPRGQDDATGPDRTDLLPPGHRVGDWVVTELIGAGGWSTVYAARPAEERRDRPGRAPDSDEVALKVMPTAGLAPRQARRIVESARREVELGRRAGHPRLIGLRESFVLSAPELPAVDGAIVLVMERAAGSLRELLDAGASGADRGRLIAGICEGLAHLHRSGWVHADLKPENVLLGRDGSVKLSDFGLATELTGTHGYVPPMGTLDYLPPERWRAPLGELGVQVRPSADIWALGVVIHEVFAGGASPFPGATPVARGAAVQEYGEGRAPLRMDHAVPPFWRALAADCLAPTHAARAPHTAERLLARIAARESAQGGTREDTSESTRETEPHDAGTRGPGARGAGARPARGRARAVVLAAALCGAAGTTLWADAVREDPSGRAGGRARTVEVFNAERGCQDRVDRDPQCSLGLAIDPLRPYAAGNVVPTRVWHGDVLTADCRLPDGQPVIDEEDLQSTLWFRVRLPHGSPYPAAWLPAVRTKDRPPLPGCPRPPAVR
ncbi:serine/threonine-protein kinase [Streptomyces litmocidini]|uniref:serine/threonine-protein kinase n=1 Tax=Streptomyces litmocidini TaxID=67318 RepID=UPI0033D2A194